MKILPTFCAPIPASVNCRVTPLGNTPLMRFNEVHNSVALIHTGRSGIQHINHQVETNDDVLRSFYHLRDQRLPIFLGTGRHPTSGARFLYFKGPDGMVFEYSTGVMLIEEEESYRPRQFNFEPDAMCMRGSAENMKL
ncbi:VOC family protein [Paracoccus sp. S1E-3]|uniref:VOC family protein n=1 Tax=Paracoccus sp. S1E-3 TaxID=2756130 RepID=UPI0015EE9058|nr:VOC family protein [Paracoccus sp. S1E-3]MBA4491128.1 VOC family protein [Paracoccus sp. S1E-3]